MKRAALVVATSVALLLSGVSVSAHAATRKYVSMPSDGQVIGSGRGSSVSGDLLTVPGDPIEGEYIPSSYGGGSKGTKLPVQPQYQYVKSRTIRGMTNNLRGGVYGVALGVGLQFLLDQVDGFIDENGQPVKRVPDDGSGYSPSPTDLRWYMAKPHSSTPTQPISGSAVGVCTIYGKAFAAGYTGVTYVGSSISGENATQATCNYQFNQNGQVKSGTAIATRTGETCPTGYERTGNSCVKTASGTTPLTDADYDLMEAAAAAKDSEWLKDRLREHCEGSLNPQGCYDSLRENTWLSGPSTLSEPGPTTTTVGLSGTTITNSNTKIDITYGDNYYDYRTTKTTTKTNPDGTTETTTETEPDTDEPVEQKPEDMPALGDPYSPYINKLNEIKADVSAPPSVVPSIGYSSWYSFGGGCSELSFELPIYGSFTTNYCPYIYDWVRPILAFLFAVFTWHYCRSLWSEAVTQARPM